ncbi:MAG TPA: hypothetical protein VLX59_03860 [Acidimicrobiales bacterium]|nr:hypothetical protein [Acidimicrobiales bacterium]
MSEMTVEDLQAALARYASARGEVFPSALGLIDAECHPTGRVWEVAGLLMTDQEEMRYLSGGNRPDEVADTVGRWAESKLSLEQIKTVIEAGGYDPDPFEPLAVAGHLRQVLYDGDATRIIQGERAGMWISDQMALTADSDVVAKVLEAINPAPISERTQAAPRRSS